MTSTLRQVGMGGLRVVGILAGAVFVTAAVAAIIAPLIAAVAWGVGFASFEATIIVMLLWLCVGATL